MSIEPDFAEFIRRIRAGEPDAAAELVKRFEPLVRRAVRVRLGDGRFRRAVDSGDVCQSVLASFFVRAAAGQYDFDDPGQLAALLSRMARNKAASVIRAQTSARRDVRRAAGDGGAVLEALPGRDPTASQVVAGKELFDKFRELLTPGERELIDLRAQGQSWAEMAEKLGGTPDALRVQVARAVRRASAALGIDDGSDPDEPT